MNLGVSYSVLYNEICVIWYYLWFLFVFFGVNYFWFGFICGIDVSRVICIGGYFFNCYSFFCMYEKFWVMNREIYLFFFLWVWDLFEIF